MHRFAENLRIIFVQHNQSYELPCSNGPPQTYRIETEGRTVAEIKELTTGRTYETWVTASTRAGEGAASRRVSHTPTQRGISIISDPNYTFI